MIFLLYFICDFLACIHLFLFWYFSYSWIQTSYWWLFGHLLVILPLFPYAPKCWLRGELYAEQVSHFLTTQIDHICQCLHNKKHLASEAHSLLGHSLHTLLYSIQNESAFYCECLYVLLMIFLSIFKQNLGGYYLRFEFIL